MGRVIQASKDFSRIVHYAQAKLVKEETSGTPGEAGYMTNSTYNVPTTESKVWQDIQEAYEEALPGMKGMWHREAVVGEERQLPGHLKIGFVEPKNEVTLDVTVNHPYTYKSVTELGQDAYRRKPRGYLDPMWNQLVQVHLEFQCSWAVARDWHRHRTAYPWHLNIVDYNRFILHEAYVPQSKFAWDERIQTKTHDGLDWETSRTESLLERSHALFMKFREAGDMEKAMLCIPFGALVSMRTTMGLRDAVYMLELRHYAEGANPEYKAQAGEALRQLKVQLGAELCSVIFPEG
jgi:hypothetical protein